MIYRIQGGIRPSGGHISHLIVFVGEFKDFLSSLTYIALSSGTRLSLFPILSKKSLHFLL